MSITDLFRFGFINLWRRKTRTFLTALSMAIGVMCIVVLISVGLGYEQAYRESIEALGSLTKIDVTPATGDYGRKALLNDKALEAFWGIDGVEAVTPVYVPLCRTAFAGESSLWQIGRCGICPPARGIFSPTQRKRPPQPCVCCSK